ncbi:MAG: hypothetical protein U1C74_17565 [Phenylobacterium sp.]|nr:hypothetical protein [Phenylobacterium sp.]
MKTHYPEDYRRLKERLATALANNSTDEITQAMDATFAEVMARQADKMDGTTVYAVQKVLRDQAASLQGTDPAACLAILSGRASAATLQKVRTPQAMAADDAAMAQILIQTAEKPASPATPMALEEFLAQSMKALQTQPDADQDHVIAILKEEREPESPAETRAYCDFNLALADVFLAQPPAQGGEALRRKALME